VLQEIPEGEEGYSIHIFSTHFEDTPFKVCDAFTVSEVEKATNLDGPNTTTVMIRQWLLLQFAAILYRVLTATSFRNGAQFVD